MALDTSQIQRRQTVFVAALDGVRGGKCCERRDSGHDDACEANAQQGWIKRKRSQARLVIEPTMRSRITQDRLRTDCQLD